MGKITIIYQNGEAAPAPCSNLTLETMQKAVGGCIETVPYFTSYEGEKYVAYCDGEGKLKDYPINKVATLLWYDQLHRAGIAPPYADVLVGAVLIVQGADLLRKL